MVSKIGSCRRTRLDAPVAADLPGSDSSVAPSEFGSDRGASRSRRATFLLYAAQSLEGPLAASSRFRPVIVLLAICLRRWFVPSITSIVVEPVLPSPAVCRRPEVLASVMFEYAVTIPIGHSVGTDTPVPCKLAGQTQIVSASPTLFIGSPLAIIRGLLNPSPRACLRVLTTVAQPHGITDLDRGHSSPGYIAPLRAAF